MTQSEIETIFRTHFETYQDIKYTDDEWEVFKVDNRVQFLFQISLITYVLKLKDENAT